MSNRKPKPAAETVATRHPLERLHAAQTKLEEIAAAIADVVRDVEAANIALLAVPAVQQLEAEALMEPLAASEQVDKIMASLTQVEEQAKSAAKEARESGKLAEHLLYGVRSLYREVLARGDQERARMREVEAARQKTLFPISEDRN